MNSSTSNSKGTLKRVRKYLVVFFSLILFLFLFDRGLFYLLYKAEADFYGKNEYEKQLEAFVKGKGYNTLILGTSRTYEGIHPSYIERFLHQKAFKESYVGKGPKYNYYFYQLYKTYAGIPKVVIYGVDYFIYTITSDTKWIARFKNAESEKEKKIGYFSAPLLLVKHKKKIDNFLNNVVISLTEKMEKGKPGEPFKDFIHMQTYEGSPNKSKDSKEVRPGRFTRQLFPPPPGVEGEYFTKLLDELKQDGVTVVLVGLPDHIGTYKTNFQRQDFIQHLKELRRKYKNLFFYNYNRPNQFPLSKERYFNDGGFGQTNSHLSREGARAFNEMLAGDLEKHY